jgi:tRNA A37 threonylcarbamoyladenosine dehydratase
VDKFIIKDYDYVVDAVDDIEAKIAIIKQCKKLNIKIISSMGMANRLSPLDISIVDISKTEMCPLAKIIRKRLKEEKIEKVKVIFSKEIPVKTDSKILGSVSYVPSVAGLIIASEVIKDLKEN